MINIQYSFNKKKVFDIPKIYQIFKKINEAVTLFYAPLEKKSWKETYDTIFGMNIRVELKKWELPLVIVTLTQAIMTIFLLMWTH